MNFFPAFLTNLAQFAKIMYFFVVEFILDSTSAKDLSYNDAADAVSRMQGVFKPNINGRHQFKITANGNIRLKFNPTGNTEADAVSTLYKSCQIIRRLFENYCIKQLS